MALLLRPSDLRTTSKAGLRLLTAIGLLLPMLMAPPVYATHETINIDGILGDLIVAIGRNSGAANGGFVIPDVQGETYTDVCRYVNGYDVRNYYFFLDFKTPAGGTASNVRLYGGWDVFGIIGDVDGDGNPNTFDPNGPGGRTLCAVDDEFGIGPTESYTVDFDYNCDGVVDHRIEVSNNRVQQTVPTRVDLTGRSAFAMNGGFLEMRVDNFQDLVPADADPCNARIRMTANSELDAPGEDRSAEIRLAIEPSIAVTKTPDKQAACPGEVVTWTIVVTNDGLCRLGTTSVEDVLDPGLTFVSSTPSRVSGDAQRSVWSFPSLARGQSLPPIALRTLAGPTCSGQLKNSVSVQGTFQPPQPCGVLASFVTAADTALLNCAPCAECDITVSPGPVVCAGTRVELCGSTGFAAYEWTLPGGGIVRERCVLIPSATPIHSGGYTLKVTLASGETDTCSTKLTVNEVICSIEGPKVACAGDTVELCGPQGPYTYRWTLPNNSVRTTRCVKIAPASEANSGLYTLVVTDPATNCSATCSHSLTVDVAPPAKINGPSFACFGSRVELCATEGNYNYLWTLPDGRTSTSRCMTIDAVAMVHSGRYKLVITDRSSGCKSTVEHTLTVTPPLVCSITGGKNVCLGAPFELCGPGPAEDFAYKWTLPGGEVRNTRCVSVAAATTRHAGLYTLELTELRTGCKSTCSHTVVVGAPPCSISGPTAVCEGSRVQLCGPQGDFTYLWTLPDRTTRTTRCVTIPAAARTDAGTYTLKVTDNVTGCSRTCDHKLAVNPLPPCIIVGTAEDVEMLDREGPLSPGIEPPAICVGSPLQLCGPSGNYTYQWTLPDGSTRTGRCVTIPAARLEDGGLYTLTVTDPATGCSSTCDRKVVVTPPPPCKITGPETVCAGAPAELCGPTGPYTYHWTRPDGSTSTMRCITIAAVGQANAGRYQLRVTDPVTGCVSTCEHTLRIGAPPCEIVPRVPGPGATPGVTQVCVGEPVEFCGPEGPFEYRWTLPDNSTRTTRCIQIPSARLADRGTYRLTVTDPVNQCQRSCSHELRVGDAPCEVTGPTQAIIGDRVRLCGPAGNFDYHWTLPDDSKRTDSCIVIQSVTLQDAGTYTLRVTERTSGCTKTCPHELRVVPGCNLTVVKTARPDVIIPTPPPSCQTISGDLRSLTFTYTGQTCAATNNRQDPSKHKCDDFGALGSSPVQIVYTGRDPQQFSMSPSGETVRIGDLVTLTATGRSKLHSESKFEIRRGGAKLQELLIHTSCSQPLAAGDVFGSLTVAGLNGQMGGGQEVEYQYVVTNAGPDLVNVTLDDDKLGLITPPFSLPSGQSRTLSKTTRISQTTTNTVVASGEVLRAGGPVCRDTAQATVTVTAPPQTCADGKPSALVFEYTGQTCSATRHSQDPGKVSCDDLGPLSEPVQVVYTGSNPQDFTITPSGETLRIGDRFTISARDKFRSDTFFEIRRGGVALQRIKLHTSCSQPLIVGEQFGSLILREFRTRGGLAAGLVPAESRPAIEEPAAGSRDLPVFDLEIRPATVISGQATVAFSLSRGGSVRLTVHDVQGRLVATLAQGTWTAGRHQATWDPGAGARGGSGIYFIRLEASEGVLTRKVAHLR